VRIVVKIANQLSVGPRIDFLKEISELPKVVLNSEAFVDSRSILAELSLVAGHTDSAKVALTASKSVLDKTAGADVSVYSNYHKSWAAYYKVLGEPEEFYKAALQYVAYTPLDSLSKLELSNLAFDLGIAALLGENIFNFGDLLEHPIIESLQGTENQWLAEVIYAFNTGDISKWRELQSAHAESLNKQQLLRDRHELLDDKIAVMSLVEHIFKRPSDDRNIPFEDIAQACERSVDKVEVLVMRALSLGLIRGTIDEVISKVNVKWVQPRILNKEQIAHLNSNLVDWGEKVKGAMRLMESGVTHELGS